MGGRAQSTALSVRDMNAVRALAFGPSRSESDAQGPERGHHSLSEQAHAHTAHPHEATRQPRAVHVEDHDGRDGHGAQPVDVRTIVASVLARRGVDIGRFGDVAVRMLPVHGNEARAVSVLG
eukprot:7386317-Prymnesium_polylepis.1